MRKSQCTREDNTYNTQQIILQEYNDFSSKFYVKGVFDVHESSLYGQDNVTTYTTHFH